MNKKKNIKIINERWEVLRYTLSVRLRKGMQFCES